MSSEASCPAGVWPELKADHPIISLFQKLPDVLSASEGYSEIWGVTLTGPQPVPALVASPELVEENKDETTSSKEDSAPIEQTVVPVEQPTFATALILQKFLRANSNKVNSAFEQLKDTMVWRKSFFSAGGEAEKGWSDVKFAGLGYTTLMKTKQDPEHDTVVAWNIYGAVKDIKATFCDTDEFIRWRVALMEQSLEMLALANATKPIPDFGAGPDPYQSIQVHDYLKFSFIFLPSEVKTASRKTISLFGRYYPETLSQKFFVNVPRLMGWVYTVMKNIVAKETLKKLEMLSDGKQLASTIGESVPEVYGGKSESLDTVGQTVKSPKDVDGEKAAAAEAEAAAKKEAEAAAKKEAEATEATRGEARAETAPETQPVVATNTEDAAPTPAPEPVSDKPATIDPLPLTETKVEEPVAPVTVVEPVTAEPIQTLPMTAEEPATIEEEKPEDTTVLPVVPEVSK